EGSRFSIVIPCRAFAASHWPKLASHDGQTRVCVLDVASPATADVLRRYLSAAGFDVVAGMADAPQARLICGDASRVDAHAGRDSATALLALASSPGEQAIRGADRVIALPLLRSDIETVLAAIARGDTIVPPAESEAGARERAPRFSPFRVLVA